MNFKDLRTNLLNEAQLDHAQQITALVRKGLMPQKDIATLKLALIRKKRIGGQAVRGAQREVLDRYTDALAGAVYGSTSATQAAGRNLQKNSFEPEHTNFVLEAANMPHDPPMVMVLKRKGIRIFPDGRKVALYTNDQLGLTFTVPYVGGSQIEPTVSTGVQEEIDYGSEILNENIKRLRFASSKKGTPVSIGFETQDPNMNVDPITANAITSLHSQLSPENKIELVRKISKSPEDFKHVASFAHRYTTHKPEKPKQPAAQPAQPVKKGKPAKK